MLEEKRKETKQEWGKAELCVPPSVYWSWRKMGSWIGSLLQQAVCEEVADPGFFSKDSYRSQRRWREENGEGEWK